MTKTELIAAVAEKAGLTKKDADRVVAATFETIAQALANGDKVQISGFGIFDTKKREARTGLNPRTKETIQIPASTQPVFKAGKALKDQVSK
jgi:DNA-binding protein HU-beta